MHGRCEPERVFGRRIWPRAVAVALVAGLTACGNAVAGNSPSLAKATPSGPVAQVQMADDNRYTPATLTVAKGTTVIWKNTGTMPHNVVTDGSFAADKAHAALPAGVRPFVSPMLMGGGSWAYTFDTPGEYVYFCQPHEAVGMVGRITVTP